MVFKQFLFNYIEIYFILYHAFSILSDDSPSSSLNRKSDSIIFVVGKSPMDIMESILCRKSSIEKIIWNHYFLSQNHSILKTQISKKKGRNLSFLDLSFSSTYYSWQRAQINLIFLINLFISYSNKPYIDHDNLFNILVRIREPLIN